MTSSDVRDPATGEPVGRRARRVGPGRGRDACANARGTAGLLKVGLELFAAHGPASVERVRAFAPVFLDLKLHDIPTTVEHAARNAARLGIDMLTVHALGGEAMVAAAVRVRPTARPRTAPRPRSSR